MIHAQISAAFPPPKQSNPNQKLPISAAFPPPKQSNPNQKLPAALDREITATILEGLVDHLKINSAFLLRFYNFSLDKFHAAREKLLEKMERDMMYRASFKTFLANLINTVFKLTRQEPKESKLSPLELRIREDLELYPYDWRNVNVKLFEDEKATEFIEPSDDLEPLVSLEEIPEKLEKIPEIKEKFQDVFTREIDDDDPLWRVRAYLIGFFYADASIRAQRSYVLSITQNLKDIEILRNIQNAMGGKLSGPYKGDIYHLTIYGKELILQLIQFGLKQNHSNQEIANKILPPNFVGRMINDKTLVKDFIRGFFDGDGVFSGSYEDRSVRFGFPGPDLFLKEIRNLILEEVEDITSFITKESIRYFKHGKEKHRLYSKFRIYKKGYGFHTLTEKELGEGIIEKAKHPWLKRLHISGSLNCIKFYNWLYEDNDEFNLLKIEGINLCGIRKFQKCLTILGNSLSRKERLAPNWCDVLADVTSFLENKLYNIRELMKLNNEYLFQKLHNLNLEHLFENNRVKNQDSFRLRLKYLEYQDNLIERIQVRKGRSNINYYFNKENPPKIIPKDSKRKIELINRDNSIKKNLKNFIILISLSAREPLNYNYIENSLKQSNNFKRTTLRPNRIKLDLIELISFEIIFTDKMDKELEEQEFRINIRKLPFYYKKDLSEIKRNLHDIFINK